MSEPIPFVAFNKISRFSRSVIITEKIDGTNATVFIDGIGTDNVTFLTGSRNRWITPQDDNYGFSRWAHDHKDDLLKMGNGWHRGEWWGAGIQRKYGMTEKVFSLFNTSRNLADLCGCVRTVPVLWAGGMDQVPVTEILLDLATNGSKAAPGFMNPEGVVIYHTASKMYFKKTIANDDKAKNQIEDA